MSYKSGDIGAEEKRNQLLKNKQKTQAIELKKEGVVKLMYAELHKTLFETKFKGSQETVMFFITDQSIDTTKDAVFEERGLWCQHGLIVGLFGVNSNKFKRQNDE